MHKIREIDFLHSDTHSNMIRLYHVHRVLPLEGRNRFQVSDVPLIG